MNKPVVLITGALTGIGRATALAFAKDGARLVVSGRREAEGKALEAELRRLGAEAAFIQADVRRDNEVSNLVDKTVARFGRLDVAVNNAGTEGQVGPITDQTAESYAATFDTNVLGVILSMKHEVRVMQGQGSGSIINISSTYGHEGAAGASVYVGSKHAVEGITKSVAAGPIIAAGGFDRDGAMAIVKSGDADLLAFGRSFTSNPDLRYRLKYNLPLRALRILGRRREGSTIIQTERSLCHALSSSRRPGDRKFSNSSRRRSRPPARPRFASRSKRSASIAPSRCGAPTCTSSRW